VAHIIYDRPNIIFGLKLGLKLKSFWSKFGPKIESSGRLHRFLPCPPSSETESVARAAQPARPWWRSLAATKVASGQGRRGEMASCNVWEGRRDEPRRRQDIDAGGGEGGGGHAAACARSQTGTKRWPDPKPPLANIFFLGEKEIELRTEHSNFFIQV
jgi:hypothetical protein